MDSEHTTQSAAAADDVERAATGSLDNLAIRVAATGSLLLDGIFSLLLVNYNEDVGFFFFGLKSRALSGAVAVPIEDTRGNHSHSNHSATSSQNECCSSLMSAAPVHFNVVLTAFRLWLVFRPATESLGTKASTTLRAAPERKQKSLMMAMTRSSKPLALRVSLIVLVGQKSRCSFNQWVR